MSSFVLNHPEVTTFVKTLGIPGKDTKFQDLMSMINSYAKKHIELSDNEDDPADEQKKFKGNMFEVFGEYFIREFETDKRVGIANYFPNVADDMGVDGTGTGMDGNPAVVQFKYRTNINDPLNYRTLATFGNDAFARYGITENTTHNMVVLSTAVELYYTVKKVNRDLRFIGYNHIREMTNDNPQFWQGFADSLRKSTKTPLARRKRTLWENQISALEAIINFLKSDEERGQIIIPTGGGKTLIEHESVNESIKLGGIVHLVVAPRISLVQQIQREMWAFKSAPWSMLCVCSGEREMLEYYADQKEEWGDNHTKPTTKTDDIKTAIVNAIETQTPIVIFSTNHSVLKIGSALNQLETSADLIVGDEAHNFTAENFQLALDVLELPTAKWLFFTATRKIDFTGKGRGMNNYSRFGRVIYTIPPINLMRAGRTVPPRLHIVHYSPDVVPGEYDSENIKNFAAMIIEGVREHKKAMNNEACRVIVFCDSALDAHSFIDCQSLKDALPEFYMGAVTSHDNLMENQRSEHNTNGRSNLRREIFNKFSSSKYSLLFHYDIVSEGIDLPGATGILPLRPLGEIKATQAIGRTIRVNDQDRIALFEERIAPGDSEGWTKPYGWVILPIVYGKNVDDMKRIESIVHALRANDYDIDTEMLAVISNPKGQKPPKPDFDPNIPDENVSFDELFDKSDLDNIRKNVHHEFEDENKVIVLPRTTIKQISDDSFDAVFS